MKSNPKPILRQSSLSQFKLKSDGQGSTQALPKDPLRKVSSSLKIKVKTQQPIQQKIMIKKQTTQQGTTNNKKSSKIQTEPITSILEGISRKAVGWTELDKIKYQLVIEKRLRESLERENEMLKKEINFLNNFGTSMRASINSKKANDEGQMSNKDKILNRLNKKRDGVTTDKDNDSTGLCSAKTKTSEQKIVQMYEQYAKKRIPPLLENIFEVATNYFNEYQENYSKLLVMFNQSKGTQKTALFQKMEDLMFLFQVPILYKERPRQLMSSLSKEKSKSKKSSLNSSFQKVKSKKQDGDPKEKATSKIKSKKGQL